VARRTKIVCTLGPAVASYERIKELAEAGMDVARLNLSHGDPAEHAANFAWVRKASDELGKAIGIMADLQGPKIRLGRFRDGSVLWQAGERVALVTEEVLGSEHLASVDLPSLPKWLNPGDQLLVDDGNVVLQVLEVSDTEVSCEVVEGGIVSDHKGIAAPGVDFEEGPLGAKDQADLNFALELGVDMVAISFVRGPEDGLAARAILERAGAGGVDLVAKIEVRQALSQVEEILSVFDAVMVARGDLALEIALEQVPLVQKQVIELARRYGRPVIVATQMLESMTVHSRPTRAEASDVANAVLDGADALMLSAESSVGAHPTEAVRTMARIAETAESALLARSEASLSPGGVSRSSGESLAKAAVEVACDIGARALVAFTETGATAKRLARYRPPVPIVAFTPAPKVRNQLSMCWGVDAYLVETVSSTDEMVRQVDEALRQTQRAETDDRVVIVAGTPSGMPGTTNTIRVHRIGNWG
jgi:pyruvate kinase